MWEEHNDWTWKEEVEVKNVKSQIRKWNEDYAVRGSMYSSNTSSDFQFGRSLQTWKLLCNEMEEEEWKMLSLERWIFERHTSSIWKKCLLNRTVILRNNARK